MESDTFKNLPMLLEHAQKSWSKPIDNCEGQVPMRNPILRSLVAGLAGLLLAATAFGTQRRGLYNEAMIRERVIKRVMPEFPRETPVDSSLGIVVVAVVFDEEGKLSQAEVLDAPHPLIKQAVLDALKLWETGRFTTSNGPLQLVGWLSFACIIKDGKRVIEYTHRTNEDNKPDKRYTHPFSRAHPRMPFYYHYHFGSTLR